MIFNMLNDLVTWTRREGFSGALRQVGLEEVIQMECNARHSSILEIRNEHLRGKFTSRPVPSRTPPWHPDR